MAKLYRIPPFKRKRKAKKRISLSEKRRRFIRNERRASMAISAWRQLGIGPDPMKND